MQKNDKSFQIYLHIFGEYLLQVYLLSTSINVNSTKHAEKPMETMESLNKIRNRWDQEFVILESICIGKSLSGILEREHSWTWTV